MQTQAISNLKSNIKFQSREDAKNAEVFVNMSDAQLQELAYASVDKRKEKKFHNSLTALFVAMPIVDSIASGVLAEEKVGEVHLISPFGIFGKIDLHDPARLSERLGATGKTALGWGFVLAVIGIYSAIKHQFVKDSHGAKRFGQEHPVLSFAGDLAIILGASILGAMGLGKLSDKLKEKYPKSAEEFSAKVTKTAENIDKSKFNEKTLPKMEKWFTELGLNHPFVAKSGKFLLANSVWIILGAAIVKMIGHNNKKCNELERNYQDLRTAQIATARHLMTTANVQKDILAKQQPKLAEDLEKLVSGEKPVSAKEIAEIKKAAKIYEEEKIKIKAWENEMAKKSPEPEVINDIEILKVIYIPDKEEECEKCKNEK